MSGPTRQWQRSLRADQCAIVPSNGFSEDAMRALFEKCVLCPAELDRAGCPGRYRQTTRSTGDRVPFRGPAPPPDAEAITRRALHEARHANELTT